MPSRIPIDRLEKIVGKDNVQIRSEKIFVSPENSSAVSEIVKLANQEKFKILPLGSGSILDWSKLPSLRQAPFGSEPQGRRQGGDSSASLTVPEEGRREQSRTAEDMIILKSDRLSRVKKVLPEDLYVILQSGFPLKDLNHHLEPFNLFYPLAPQRAGQAETISAGTMGGAVATNLKAFILKIHPEGKSGERSIQTREYVLALEVIDPEGQILNLGARTFKSVTGYDLPRLFVGSWGTLGFICEISLRLMPARKRKDYADIILDPPRRGEIKGQNNFKTILSSRIKKSLDPNQVFFSLDSLV
ncbi:MAG: FAD-binding oxidoreductase [candidate division Zixibacteria bacterium]|nr:FAD-binding oxidoreductase [candidate division Zixibacteria bacterium]